MRPQAGRTCEQSMLSSYPASIVCLRAKHACRPKYAFGERIHAGTTCLHSCARRAGVGWGLNRKLELRPKRHELIFGGIPSSLVIHPKRKPFSHAFGFGFGKIVVSASELCSVVLILPPSTKNRRRALRALFSAKSLQLRGLFLANIFAFISAIRAPTS